MPKAKTFLINGKCVQLPDDALVEMLVRYAKEYTSPNDVYHKVCGEIGLPWTKKSIMKLANLYNKLYNKLNSKSGHKFIDKNLLIETFSKVVCETRPLKSAAEKCCHEMEVYLSTSNTDKIRRIHRVCIKQVINNSNFNLQPNYCRFISQVNPWSNHRKGPTISPVVIHCKCQVKFIIHYTLFT